MGGQRLGRGLPVNLAKGFGGTGTVNYIPTSCGRELFARLSKKIRKAAAHSMVLLVVIAERSAAPIDERRSGAGRTSRQDVCQGCLRLTCHRQTKPGTFFARHARRARRAVPLPSPGTEGWLQLRLEYNLQYLLARSFCAQNPAEWAVFLGFLVPKIYQKTLKTKYFFDRRRGGIEVRPRFWAFPPPTAGKRACRARKART